MRYTTVPQPWHLRLEDLITRLKVENPAKRLRLGFNRPHSYRGYYDELAFEVAKDVTVGQMVAAAEEADGATYFGWKGGEYTMDGLTPVWLVTQRGDCGESLGVLLLEYMLADVTSPEVSS